MARYKLTPADIENLQSQVHDLDREQTKWREFVPVNPNGKPKWAHYERYFKVKTVPDGVWTLVKQNAEIEENAVSGYEPADIYYWRLTKLWQIHKNTIAISENGRIKSDTIEQIQKVMNKQIEKAILGGGTMTGTTVYGMTNTSGTNEGTDGNGNGMTNIYNLVKELKNKLTEDYYDDREKYWFVYDSTIDGYLDILNTNGDMTARKMLLENGMINESRMYMSGQLTNDSSDAAMLLCEVDPKSFYVSELTDGIEVHPFLDGALDTDFYYKGYLEWAGAIIIPKPESIAHNLGVASA